MNRTDRLYAVREELRRAGSAGRTAEQLANRFEIGVRTIKRDIAALQQAGFPVWARLGRVGGYVVDAAATLPPVNITEKEASALAAALAAHRGQPFYADGQTALTKILAVMDAQARARTKRLSARIWINDATVATSTTKTRAAVERALHERRVLAIRYRGSDERISERRIDPQMLASTTGHWYLVAYCRLRRDLRWFRLDRIERATVTAQTCNDIPLAEIGEPPTTAKSLTTLNALS
jgi:predicted DNA-binding transcriptional regulator YafY